MVNKEAANEFRQTVDTALRSTFDDVVKTIKKSDLAEGFVLCGGILHESVGETVSVSQMLHSSNVPAPVMIDMLEEIISKIKKDHSSCCLNRTTETDTDGEELLINVCAVLYGRFPKNVITKNLFVRESKRVINAMTGGIELPNSVIEEIEQFAKVMDFVTEEEAVDNFLKQFNGVVPIVRNADDTVNPNMVMDRAEEIIENLALEEHTKESIFNSLMMMILQGSRDDL